MKDRTFFAKLLFMLGILSIFAVFACFLGLTDIYHGEPDLDAEWRIVQISFIIILIFNILASVAFYNRINRLTRT